MGVATLGRQTVNRGIGCLKRRHLEFVLSLLDGLGERSGNVALPADNYLSGFTIDGESNRPFS